MTAQHPQPTRIYLDKAKPDDFINARKGDWIYLVGDITTDYELDFIKRFGAALKTTHTPAQERIDAVIKELEKRERKANRSGYTNWPQSSLIHSISYTDAIALLQAGDQHE